MLRKAGETAPVPPADDEAPLDPAEVRQLALLARYPGAVAEAAEHRSPAEIAQYAYDLARAYNQFYDRLSVLNADRPVDRQRRLAISAFTARTLRSALGLLGIGAPERM
jgi:arginyl-tRNA synthetase